jgi:Mg2+-importing ATPase
VCSALSTSSQGLSSAEAQDRLNQAGRNLLRPQGRIGPVLLFLNQFNSPLVLILVFAAAVSVLTGELIDASIILAIVVASAVLGFIQEYNAGNAVEKLRSQVTLKTTVLRDGQPRSILAEIDGNESKPCN